MKAISLLAFLLTISIGAWAQQGVIKVVTLQGGGNPPNYFTEALRQASPHSVEQTISGVLSRGTWEPATAIGDLVGDTPVSRQVQSEIKSACEGLVPTSRRSDVIDSWNALSTRIDRTKELLSCTTTTSQRNAAWVRAVSDSLRQRGKTHYIAVVLHHACWWDVDKRDERLMKLGECAAMWSVMGVSDKEQVSGPNHGMYRYGRYENVEAKQRNYTGQLLPAIADHMRGSLNTTLGQLPR